MIGDRAVYGIHHRIVVIGHTMEQQWGILWSIP